MPVALLDFLTSREQAILLWTAAGLLFVISKDRGILGALVELARCTTGSWKLLAIFGSAALWTGLLVYLAHSYGLWHMSSAKETVYWFLGTAIVLAANSSGLTRKPHFLRELILKVLGAGFLAVVLEFAVNYYTFHLGVEVVLVFATLLATFASQRMLSAIGLILIAVTAVRVLGDLEGLLTRANAEALLISPVLTVSLIPFLYAWGLVIGYEHVFMRVGQLEARGSYPRGVRWAVFRACGFKLARVRRFTQTQTSSLYELVAQEDVVEMIEAFRQSDDSARAA